MYFVWIKLPSSSISIFLKRGSRHILFKLHYGYFNAECIGQFDLQNIVARDIENTILYFMIHIG